MSVDLIAGHVYRKTIGVFGEKRIINPAGNNDCIKMQRDALGKLRKNLGESAR